jgi:thiol-disulfide isomerase/thioredoxin
MNRSRVSVALARRPAWPAVGALFFAALLALAGCSKQAGRDLQPGIYRATVELPGEKLVPFGLDVAQEEEGKVLYVVNGEERIRLDELKLAPGSFEARFPGFETVLQARVSGDDLSGEITLPHANGKTIKLPFKAKLGESWRFFAEPLPSNADFAGRWSVTFTDESQRRVAGVAQFEQSFERVSGTVQLPDADQRYLAGEAHDEELKLSRFDGAAAVLYEGKLDAKGEWVGTMWTDRGGARRFVAKRDADATIDTVSLATRLRNPAEPFRFAFRDLDGTTVASDDPRFKDKVLLVTLAGSWCPNSHDEAALLVALDRKYRDQGLRVVSLMFEQHADFDKAVRAVQRFRAATGIRYPTLIAGEADKAKASAALPQLEAVVAYPTAILIDRTGLVRKIHTGFAGPATGVHHEVLARDFELGIEELLASAPASGPPPAATSP